MHNSITWAALLGAFLIVGGLAAAAIGALSVFAGGMSDAAEGGDSYASLGCGAVVGGIFALATGILVLIR